MAGTDDSLQGLLAILLAYEAALFQLHVAPEFVAGWSQNLACHAQNHGTNSELLTMYLWQSAAEIAYGRGLMRDLRTAVAPESGARPAVQGVFCIDVRSEPLRRSLEATSPAIETLGFAGFFGFPIEVIPFGAQQGSARCPVLLTPKFRIRQSPTGASPQGVESALDQHLFSKRLARGWNSFKTSAVSCFSFVETGGLLAGVKIVQDSLGMSRDKDLALSPCVNHVGESGMTPDEQIAVAANALKHMGLSQVRAPRDDLRTWQQHDQQPLWFGPRLRRVRRA